MAHCPRSAAASMPSTGRFSSAGYYSSTFFDVAVGPGYTRSQQRQANTTGGRDSSRNYLGVEITLRHISTLRPRRGRTHRRPFFPARNTRGHDGRQPSELARASARAEQLHVGGHTTCAKSVEFAQDHSFRRTRASRSNSSSWVGRRRVRQCELVGPTRAATSNG